MKEVDTGEVRRLDLVNCVERKLTTRLSPGEEARLITLMAKDDDGSYEAPTFEELRVVLREVSPDDRFERRLRTERDKGLEEALDVLAEYWAMEEARKRILERQKAEGGELA